MGKLANVFSNINFHYCLPWEVTPISYLEFRWKVIQNLLEGGGWKANQNLPKGGDWSIIYFKGKMNFRNVSAPS
jgi:hypothetical protein